MTEDRSLPGYWTKLKGGQEDLASFLASFEELNEVEWRALAEDLLQESPRAYNVFQPTHGHGLLEVAATYARQLSFRMRQAWARGIEAIVVTNKDASDQAEAHDILSRSLYYAAVLQDAFNKAILIDLIRNEKLSEDIRVKAARALANQGEAVPVGYWLDLDLVTFPAMASALLSALATRQPKLALEKLRQLPTAPSNYSSLEYPLRVTLRTLLDRPLGEENLTRLMQGAPNWFVSLIKEVLDLSEFQFARASVHERFTLTLPVANDTEAAMKLLEKYCLDETTVPPWKMDSATAESLGVHWRDEWSSTHPIFSEAYRLLVEQWQRETVEHDLFSRKLHVLAQYLDPDAADRISDFEILLKEDTEFSLEFASLVEEVARQSREQELEEDAEYEEVVQ